MPVKELDLDLLPMMKRTDLKAKRRVLSTILEGSWTKMIKGRGMEFAGFRKYVYGDDASQIDWNATLRAKETLVREFEEYKNVNIFFVIDVSDSMIFASQGKWKAEYAAELVFNIALAVLDNGESVGFAMFADDIIAKLHPTMGVKVAYALSSAFENPQNYGGDLDLHNVVKLLDGYLKTRSLIVFVSDFIGMKEGWERYIKMISQKFDLIGIMLRDPLDQRLPKGGVQIIAEDPYSGDSILVDSVQYREQYAQEAKTDVNYIKSVFDKAKAGLLYIETGGDPFPDVLRYFKKRSAIINH